MVAFHLDPETGRYNNARLSGAIDEIAGPIMTRVLELREDIEAEPVRDPQQAALAAGKLQEADDLTAKLRDLADAVSAAALSTAGQPADAFDSRLNGIEGDAQRLLTQDDIESPLERAFRARLDVWLKGPRAEPIRPLHWALEFPEVMRHGGFDAIVSNPPFIGGKKVSGALGTDYREYLKQRIARDMPGNADLCSYFLLRDMSVARHGRVGIIATNTIAQGDTDVIMTAKIARAHLNEFPDYYTRLAKMEAEAEAEAEAGRCPDSYALITLWVTPARAARSTWDRPARLRAWRSSAPAVAGSMPVPCHNSHTGSELAVRRLQEGLGGRNEIHTRQADACTFFS